MSVLRELPTRKPNRLKNFDYGQSGAYFITICVKDRAEIFGYVGADSIRPHYQHTQLTDVGIVVKNGIENIGKTYEGVVVDRYVIMPNHIHMIIMINRDNGRMISAPTTTKSLSQIVGYFKQFVSRKIGFSPWQKSFHDHIIRNDDDYRKIVEYIDDNPNTWAEDCFYPK